MNDDHETGEDLDAVLVARALAELSARGAAAAPLALDARIVMRKAEVIRTIRREKAALAPISIGLPGAIAAVALAAIGALAVWADPSTAPGAMASAAIQVLLLLASVVAIMMLVTTWTDIRRRT